MSKTKEFGVVRASIHEDGTIYVDYDGQPIGQSTDGGSVLEWVIEARDNLTKAIEYIEGEKK